MQTVHFSKRFTSGALVGLTVHQSITASPETVARFHVGRTGSDVLTNDRWTITDATVTPAQPDTDTQALTRAYARVQAASQILLTLPDDVSDTAYDAAIEERKQAYTEWHKARGY